MPTYGNYDYPIEPNGDFTSPSAASKPRKVYPIESDSTVYFYEQDFIVFIDFYQPAQPGERHKSIAGLYFLKDSPISDIGGGVGKYTRTYSVLPGYDQYGRKKSYTNSVYESFVWTVPGIRTDQGLFLDNNKASSSLNNGILTIISKAPHDIDGANKGVSIYYSCKDPINKFTYYRYAERLSLSAAGSTLTVKEIKDVNTVDPISFKRSAAIAEPYQKVVTSRLDTDYWLPGVNVTTEEAVEIIQPFAIIENTTGNRTEYLSETSTPTVDEYRSWIEEGRWIVAEGSVLRRWQGGEILERTQRYVRATL